MRQLGASPDEPRRSARRIPAEAADHDHAPDSRGSDWSDGSDEQSPLPTVRQLGASPDDPRRSARRLPAEDAGHDRAPESRRTAIVRGMRFTLRRGC